MEAMKGTSLLGKLKSMISVIYSFFLWMTKVLPSAVQTLKLAFPFHDHHLRNLGLRTPLSSTARGTPSDICSYIAPPPPPSSSSLSSLLWQASSTSLTWSYSTSGDLLGTESGVHMSSNEEILQEELKYKRAQLLYLKSSTAAAAQRKQEQVGYGAMKEYPPTIPCLARALTREYVDGRLILREERGKKLGYMDAERENGRLRLTLVPLYDTSSDEEEEEEEVEEPEFIDQEEDGQSIDEDFEAENEEDKSDGDDGNEKEIEEIEEVIPIKSKKEVDNCRRRCFTYTGNGIPTSSSLFGLPILVKNV